MRLLILLLVLSTNVISKQTYIEYSISDRPDDKLLLISGGHNILEVLEVDLDNQTYAVGTTVGEVRCTNSLNRTDERPGDIIVVFLTEYVVINNSLYFNCERE